MIGGSPGSAHEVPRPTKMRIAKYDLYGMEFVEWANDLYSPTWRQTAYHLTILSPCRGRSRPLRTYVQSMLKPTI